jgi:hypothetical protein
MAMATTVIKIPESGALRWTICSKNLCRHIVKHNHVCVFDDEETRAVLDLLRKMLRILSEDRPTMQKVLESEWIVKWAILELMETTTYATTPAGSS